MRTIRMLHDFGERGTLWVPYSSVYLDYRDVNYYELPDPVENGLTLFLGRSHKK